MRATLNARIKNLVLVQAQKTPYLGVRQIAELLKNRHAITISKSTIAKIIKTKGIEKGRGRKKHLLLYQRKEIKDCGLLLLVAIDSNTGLIGSLSEELKPYFPRLEQPWLKKILFFAGFCAYLGGSYAKTAKRSGFLRLAEMYFYPARKLKYFYERLLTHKPTVSLAKVKKNLRLASSIKFIFGNNCFAYCDAKMSTFWDRPCEISEFFAPFYAVKERLLSMLKDKLIMVNYTQSFNCLSPLAIAFIEGLFSGIKKAEFLGTDNRVLDSLDCGLSRPVFLIGYYPKTFAKGTILLEKEKKLKKISLLKELFYTSALTRFAQAKTDKGIVLNNILLKSRESLAASWGLLSDKRANFEPFLEKYLCLWPDRDKTFLADMKIIENSFFTKEEENDLAGLIPGSITIEKEADLAKIAEILLSLFKAEVADFDFKGKPGQIIIGKGYCRIILKNIPGQIKQKFNALGLYLGSRRAFLV